MDAFSHLSVLISVIVGLAITQILQGFRGIVLARAKVRMYWPTLVWAALLLVINVQSWWAMFSLRKIVDWTFPEFAIVLAQTIAQYLLAGVVFPDFSGDRPVDLREHYYAHSRWFFSLFVLALACSLAKELIVYGALPERMNLAFQLYFILMAVLAAISQREWYHRALPVIAVVGFFVYTATLFARLH